MTETHQPPAINLAVDGPAGAGKSTIAREVARRLGLLHLDTGALYRAMAVHVLAAGLRPDDGDGIAALVEGTDVRVSTGLTGDARVLVDGLDVTPRLREPQVDATVSSVAAIPAVRKHLTRLQRELAARGGYVLEGRDIGTEVLPDAPHKFYITASLAERARRRFRELTLRGHRLTMEEVQRDMERRDHADSTRPLSPLRQAADAVVVDTTTMTAEEAVECILAAVGLRDPGVGLR